MIALRPALAAGYGCLAAWSELLDQINVYPVADGDTGANLRVSLAPLRDPQPESTASLGERLIRAATGNSGNIAAPFFQEFCRATGPALLAPRAAAGSLAARRALSQPREGTMLSFFEALAETLASHGDLHRSAETALASLHQKVLDTRNHLPELREAGVVDSGALAMYIFFDGFFRHLFDLQPSSASIPELFAGGLVLADDYRPPCPDGRCVDAVLEIGTAAETADDLRRAIAGFGDSLVLSEDPRHLKLHIHTGDAGRLRDHLEHHGRVLHWQDSPLGHEPSRTNQRNSKRSPLHLVTDAAGSLPRDLARQLGITLLDSYIVIGDRSLPESLGNPEEIYRLMRAGTRVSTAQAANFERHQHYRSISRQFGPSLYLAVGSAFTGNYQAACGWRESDDLGSHLTVIDSGAASGRLAAIAIAVARQAPDCTSAEELLAITRTMLESCQEWVFINELQYLVAGGRVSKAGGFFGDLLTMKPVITPTATGVKKLGVVRSRAAQVAFAIKSLRQHWRKESAPLLLLQYSDNRQWLEEEVQPQLRQLLPAAEILVVPLSLTSGVHMGPGTWSLAMAPPLPPWP